MDTKQTSKVAALCLALMAEACGGSTAEREGAAVAGVAGAAQIVQLARSQNTSSQKGTKECCAVCDSCSFPCGDSCVSNGTLCLKPQGCACYATEAPASAVPAKADPKASCVQPMPATSP